MVISLTSKLFYIFSVHWEPRKGWWLTHEDDFGDIFSVHFEFRVGWNFFVLNIKIIFSEKNNKTHKKMVSNKLHYNTMLICRGIKIFPKFIRRPTRWFETLKHYFIYRLPTVICITIPYRTKFSAYKIFWRTKSKFRQFCPKKNFFIGFLFPHTIHKKNMF